MKLRSYFLIMVFLFSASFGEAKNFLFIFGGTEAYRSIELDSTLYSAFYAIPDDQESKWEKIILFGDGKKTKFLSSSKIQGASTKQNILSKLDELVLKVKKNDQVIIYYMGHGNSVFTESISYQILMTEDEEGFLTHELGVKIKKLTSQGAKVAFINSSCFSTLSQDLLKNTGACIISTTAKYGLGYSAFDEKLANALRLAINKKVNLEQVFIFARSKDDELDFPRISSFEFKYDQLLNDLSYNSHLSPLSAKWYLSPQSDGALCDSCEEMRSETLFSQNVLESALNKQEWPLIKNKFGSLLTLEELEFKNNLINYWTQYKNYQNDIKNLQIKFLQSQFSWELDFMKGNISLDKMEKYVAFLKENNDAFIDQLAWMNNTHKINLKKLRMHLPAIEKKLEVFRKFLSENRINFRPDAESIKLINSERALYEKYFQLRKHKANPCSEIIF